MSKYSKLYRIHIEGSIVKGQLLSISGNVFNYFRSVIRLKPGQNFRVFNSESGEYLAEIADFSRNAASITIHEQIRSISDEPPLTLALSLIKPDRFIDAVCGAVQLGVTEIIPVITDLTQIHKLNYERLERCIIESLEQCERLVLPKVRPITKLNDLLKDYIFDKLIMADENATFEHRFNSLSFNNKEKIAVLIGPEGGFSDNERKLLLNDKNIYPITLGVNVLRAEIAAITALSFIQLSR